MKKIKFLLGILTIAASTSLLSSCFSDPTFGEKPTVTPAPAEAEYTITVKANVGAITIVYDGKSEQDNPFKVTKSGKLIVSAAGYVSQTIDVVLGKNKDIVLDVNLIKTPSSDVTVDDANSNTTETTVNNDDDNKKEYGSATITIPADVTTSNVDGNTNFGIGVYNTVSLGEEPTKTDDGKEYDVLVAVCEPSGAKFDKPVTITVPTDGADGLNFTCTFNGGDTDDDIAKAVIASEDGKSISANVMHFSDWTFSLFATVTDVKQETVSLFEGDVYVQNGSNTFKYSAFPSGAVIGGAGKDRGIIKTFIASQYGSVVTGSKISKTGTISSTSEGSARIRVVQEKKIVTYNSGNITFTATVYGAITIEVLYTTSDTTGHSGGTVNG